MLPPTTLTSKFSLQMGLIIFLTFGFYLTTQAQVIDTTYQKRQLETLPPAGPVKQPAPPTQNTLPPTTPAPAVKQTPEPTDEPYVEKPSVLEKMFVGGSGDLGFSSNSYYGSFFNIGASPLLGYRINKIVAVGPGLVYNYYNLGGNSFSDYGVKVFTQIQIYRSFFAHAEHQILNAKGYDVDSRGQITKEYRTTLQSTLAGAGYRQMASDRFGMDLYLLFNVANSDGVTNSRPIFRAGIIYNLK